MLKRLNKKQGFTLVEIMIVVGIITLLAALSVHGLLRARITANEAAVIKGLKTLQAAMESYRMINGVYPGNDYGPGNFNLLVNARPPYLDNAWTPDGYKVTRQGYVIEIKLIADNQQSFLLLATPVEYDGGWNYGRTFSLSQWNEYRGGSGEIIDEGTGEGLGSAGAPN